MFTSKAVEKLIENEDIESLLIRSALKPIGLPPDVEDLFVDEFCANDANDNIQGNDTPTEEPTTKKVKTRKGYESRESLPRVPKEASAWYLRYLAVDKRNMIQRGENNPDASPQDIKLAKQFKNTFRVCWSVFQEIKSLIVDRGFHDPNKKDA